MTSTRINSNIDVGSRSTDPSNIDIDYALQRGRRLRSEAFSSVLKSMFRALRANRGPGIGRAHRTEHGRGKGNFSPDCAAPT